MAEKARFRVAIVGAGIAGLTLVNALERANVEYVLLERRADFAPQVGASIGVFANGARILDQLGVWQAVKDNFITLTNQYVQDDRGRQLGKTSEVSAIAKVRSSYWTVWGEQQDLLRILYDNLHDKSRMLGSKEVVAISHDEDGVDVTCKDGSTYQADILVGADGVYSKVRNRLWELAEPENPALVAAERKRLVADYNCIFGIATDLRALGLKEGDFIHSYHNQRSAVIVASADGVIYFFVQERLARTHHLDDLPRYSEADAEAFVARNTDMPIRPDLTVQKLWDHRLAWRLVPLEEAKLQMWTWGRIALLGDSVHKTTPNLGAGGDAAMESAAVLANEIKLLADAHADGTPMDIDEIQEHLRRYQTRRKRRADAIVDASATLTRMHNLEGAKERFILRWVLPYFGEFLAERISQLIIGAEKIDFLPLPLPSLRGTRPFNPSQGYGKHESRLRRAVWALPILLLSPLATQMLDVVGSVKWAEAVRDSGHLTLSNVSIPIVRTFYGIKPVDDLISLINVFFFPTLFGYDPLIRRQMLIFLTSCLPIILIVVLESIRRANFLTVLQLPFLFLLTAQFWSIGLTMPVYCWAFYIISPVEIFGALDQRLTWRNWTPTILPAALICWTIPHFAMLFYPDPIIQQKISFLWQPSPLWMCVLTWTLSRFVADTTEQDKVDKPLGDLPTIRLTLGVGVALSAAVWLWSIAIGPFTLQELFIPAGPLWTIPDLTSFTRAFMQLDLIYGFGAALLLVVYLFGDLRRAGMMDASWASVVVLGTAATVALGPGAALGLGWMWREEIIATRRHKDALTEEKVLQMAR